MLVHSFVQQDRFFFSSLSLHGFSKVLEVEDMRNILNSNCLSWKEPPKQREHWVSGRGEPSCLSQCGGSCEGTALRSESLFKAGRAGHAGQHTATSKPVLPGSWRHQVLPETQHALTLGGRWCHCARAAGEETDTRSADVPASPSRSAAARLPGLHLCHPGAAAFTPGLAVHEGLLLPLTCLRLGCARGRDARTE